MQNKRPRYALALGLVLTLGMAMAASVGCGGDDKASTSTGSADLDAIAKDRGLTPEDMQHALKQFVPPGKHDDYVMFSSGGQGGQVLVYGVPSMRLLKTIAVFTPEPWQGYGTGSEEGKTILQEGNPAIPANTDLTWGDTHHPALSETGGDYDGRWLYINDRANGRMAMIDLRDFAHQADRRCAEHIDLARRHVRHAELGLRPRFGDSSRCRGRPAPTPTSRSTRRSSAARPRG